MPSYSTAVSLTVAPLPSRPPPEPSFLGFSYTAGRGSALGGALGFHSGYEADAFCVKDASGTPVGITVKVEGYPLMMFPLAQLPPGATHRYRGQ